MIATCVYAYTQKSACACVLVGWKRMKCKKEADEFIHEATSPLQALGRQSQLDAS